MQTPPLSEIKSGYITPTDQSIHTPTPQELTAALAAAHSAAGSQGSRRRGKKNAPMPGGRKKKRRKSRRKRKSRRRYRRGGTRKYSDSDVMKATMSLRKMAPLTKKAYLYKNKYIGGPLHKSIIEAQQKKKYRQAAANALKYSKVLENQQAGRKTRRRRRKRKSRRKYKKRRRRTRRKVQHGGAGGVELENWRPNNTYGFIKAADFSSKIPVDSHPSYTANPSMNF